MDGKIKNTHSIFRFIERNNSVQSMKNMYHKRTFVEGTTVYSTSPRDRHDIYRNLPKNAKILHQYQQIYTQYVFIISLLYIFVYIFE